MTATGARDRLVLREGSVRLVRAVPDALEDACARSYAETCFRHPYYQLSQRCLGERFDQYYLILETAGGKTLVQPVFLVRQSILGGLPASLQRGFGAQVQRWLRPVCEFTILMVGCPTGEGTLAGGATDHREVAALLCAALPHVARRLGSSLVVLKDFPCRYRAALDRLVANGFTRIPSYPACRLDLRYRDFDDYMVRSLTHQTRKNLRRKFRDAERLGGFAMEAVDDLTPVLEEVYPLYRQVWSRSAFRFEELTKEYLAGLGGALGGRGRFFVWRDSRGRIVAFSICVHDGTTLRDLYVGLDYEVALRAHLYFVTLRDLFSWAMEHGIEEYYTGQLNYDPKLHLRFRLEPLDLYLLHTSRVVNVLFRLLAPVLEPTRYDPILRRFPGPADLS